MSKRVRVLLVIFGVLVVVGAVLYMLRAASQHVPTFYRETLNADPEKQEADSKRMLRQVAALDGAMKTEGAWEAHITADQINGWLAVDLVKNHPGALPPAFRNPRVTIDSKHVTVACLMETDNYWSVVSLTVEPYLPEANVLALRIVRARAGLLPMPLGGILDRLTRAAQDMQVHLEWRQSDGDPVAILSLPVERPVGNRRVQIETLRISNGELYLAGSTTDRASAKAKTAPSTSQDVPPQAKSPAATSPAETSDKSSGKMSDKAKAEEGETSNSSHTDAPPR